MHRAAWSPRPARHDREGTGKQRWAAPLSAQIAEVKAASVALFRRDGAALRQMQEATPAFFAQLDRAVRVPILAGAGAALIRRGDTVLGAVAVSGGMVPGQDDECAEAGFSVLAP
jgi:glc operon protein GlcG